MNFEKWQALGNDYLIVEQESLPWELSAERVKLLCNPHFGPGADGVLLLAHTEEPGFAASLRIFNPDGSEAELSGNGVRQAALYMHHRGWTGGDVFSIRTEAGEVRPAIRSEREATVDMGRAKLASPDFPSGGPDGAGSLEVGGREWRFQHVSIGNPQCVIEVGEQVEALDLAAIGPAIEGHELFPNRTNVSFTRTDGDGSVRARIFERGVGETLSSGTGASGAAVAAVLRGAGSPLTVRLDGGELEVEVGEDMQVKLTGWAEPVYAGELSAELLARLERS